MKSNLSDDPSELGHCDETLVEWQLLLDYYIVRQRFISFCRRYFLDFNSIFKAAPLKLGAVVINPDSFLAYKAWVASNESLGGVHFELFVYLPQAS